jgi:outer membrane protein assembly factor BamB
MTGAYVDEDASIDLLLSTSDGKLIAVSGKDLKEIWRVQLDGALGTPVASTLNGIDPVILVSSSGGVLYVLEN